jgi:hypothetical protein
MSGYFTGPARSWPHDDCLGKALPQRPLKTWRSTCTAMGNGSQLSAGSQGQLACGASPHNWQLHDSEPPSTQHEAPAGQGAGSSSDTLHGEAGHSGRQERWSEPALSGDTARPLVERRTSEEPDHQSGTTAAALDRQLPSRRRKTKSIYIWPKQRPVSQRPAFLEKYPPLRSDSRQGVAAAGGSATRSKGLVYNVNSFLGALDTHGGKFYVPPDQYQTFLMEYHQVVGGQESCPPALAHAAPPALPEKDAPPCFRHTCRASTAVGILCPPCCRRSTLATACS